MQVQADGDIHLYLVRGNDCAEPVYLIPPVTSLRKHSQAEGRLAQLSRAPVHSTLVRAARPPHYQFHDCIATPLATSATSAKD